MLRKRKRKTSAEGATARRVTRQRRVLEDEEQRDSTVAEIASGSPRTPRVPKTPVTGRRSARKKTIAAASQDPTMSTRSRKTVLPENLRESDAENAVDPPKPKSRRAASTRRPTEPVAAEETHSTRSRAKKEARDSTGKQKRETRGKKRIAQSPKTQESKPIFGDNNSLMQLKLDRISIVTPKSSPLPVDLTPHRSSKTPKKSPVNIGSPKTHSKSPLRLSKTPRKLTVSVESPATSDKSSVSVPNQSPAGSGTPVEDNRHDSHVMLVDFMKQASKSSPKPPSPNKSSSLLTVNEIWQQVVASSPIARLVASGSKTRKSPVSTSEGPKRLRSSKKLGETAEAISPRSPEIGRAPEAVKNTTRVLPRVFRRSENANDQSLELLDCDEFVDLSGNCVNLHMNGTFDVVAENQEDEVEIDEKKAPSPQRKGEKRGSETLESTPEAKRRCRVRFASPNEEDNAKTLPQRSSPAFGTPGGDRIGARSIIGSVDPGRSKRRSRSLTKTPSSRAGAKRRSNSASAFPDRTPRLGQSIQSSVNRLSRPRQAVNSEAKSEVKVPVPRKIPNFAQIHQKKFEKMESLVEAKNRVAKRHEELKTAGPRRSSPRSPLPKKLVAVASSKNQNNEFTRFGFKLRKVQAVDMMTKKASAAARTKNHIVSNRSVLKDVRTNKRFELQMKFRKLNDDKR